VGVSALGGLAVRLRAWRLVHELAVLRSGGSEQPYLVPDALLRDARRSVSRAPGEPLIGLAVKWAANHAEARPELPASDDRVLNPACQFNVFATVAQFDTGASLASQSSAAMRSAGPTPPSRSWSPISAPAATSSLPR
jgi:hypothetical protein